jgi:hypothetical protein
MMNIQRAWSGSQTAAGVVPVYTQGMPQHLLQSADRLQPGFGRMGDQRIRPVTAMFVHDTPLKTASKVGDGTVTLEACDTDPSVEANWYLVGTVVATGLVDNNVRKFVRFSITSADGPTNVHLVATNR